MAVFPKKRRVEVEFDVETLNKKIEEIKQLMADLERTTRQAKQVLDTLNRAGSKTRDRLRTR